MDEPISISNAARHLAWVALIYCAMPFLGCRTPHASHKMVDPFVAPTLVAPIMSDEGPTEAEPKVQLTAYADKSASVPGDVVLAISPSDHLPVPKNPPPVTLATHPVDLSNALALGGANSLQVAIARARVLEAQAKHLQAKSLWLPSLRFGIGYNNHGGRLQETQGNVLEISRSSLFVGGGGGLGGAPLTAGAGGPPRLFVNLSLADAAFEPLVTCQLVRAARAGQQAAFNAELAAIADAYFGLVESSGHLASERHALTNTKRMFDQVSAFERGGMMSNTEVERVRTEQGARERAVEDASRRATTRSAELARLLRMPPHIQLAPVEDFVMPVDFLPADMNVESYIAQGLGSRPEIFEAGARLQAACWKTKQERWRPLLPNFQAGASGGTFGGGPGSDLDNFGSRGDLDLLAVWELRNAGVGNVGLKREAASLYRRSEFELAAVRDRVASEIVIAHANVESYRRQVDIAHGAVDAAGESYRLNGDRIQQGEGLPVELIQSISALVTAQNAYATAAASYNRAQYQLMRAIGRPPSASAAENAPAPDPFGGPTIDVDLPPPTVEFKTGE